MSKDLIPHTKSRVGSALALFSPARLLQAKSHASQRAPSWPGLEREPREQRHKGPFVPVAKGPRLYLLSLGKQEVPGGLLCYDNLKSLPFLPELLSAGPAR